MRSTRSTGFPLVLSPNLGCPKILSVEGMKNGGKIRLVVAGQYCKSASPTRDAFEGAFHLRPSDGAQEKVALNLVGEPKEIVGWNQLSELEDLGGTRELISSELHYGVLGGNTTYWRVEVAIEDSYDILLRKEGGRELPRLWDLVLLNEDRRSEKVNRHAVQFVGDFRKGCRYIHLTDLHLAKRNDEIVDELLTKKELSEKIADIGGGFVNFNKSFRDFISIANRQADAGELDFVVITGDLVDFAFHGWSDKANEAKSNWEVFVNLLTGAGKEALMGNPGLKVAVFTSTGNHDWRLHPYPPALHHTTYGLDRGDLKHFEYRDPDSKAFLVEKRRRLATDVEVGARKWLKRVQWWRKLGMWFAKLPHSKVPRFIMWVAGVLGLGSGGMGLGGVLGDWRFVSYIVAGVLALLLVLLVVLHSALKITLSDVIDLFVENPLDAHPSALRYYLRHVNPYLDYAFTFDRHSFVVMDTGADVFTGALLDGKQTGDLKQMSLEDNILGGSPDSRAFDSHRAYYSWSQIVWLEKVLSCVPKRDEDPGSRTSEASAKEGGSGRRHGQANVNVRNAPCYEPHPRRRSAPGWSPSANRTGARARRVRERAAHSNRRDGQVRVKCAGEHDVRWRSPSAARHRPWTLGRPRIRQPYSGVLRASLSPW